MIALTPTSQRSAPLRRNGRQQACEPCRRRKVACDHGMPVCSRCRSSEISSSCVYSTENRYRARRRKITLAPSPQPISRPTERQRPNPRQGQPLTPATPVTPLHNEDVFLGVTSYKYAMREAQSKLPPLLPTGKNKPSQNPKTQANAPSSGPMSSLLANDRLYDAAMRALRGVPEKMLSHDLLTAYVNPNDGWCRLATHRLHCSFWETFGVYLDGERSTKSLLQLATMLCDNSCKPLHEDCTDPNDWLESFSGRNMRWEGLGMLFAYWVHGAIAMRQRPQRQDGFSGDWTTHILRYKDCAWDILDLTRHTSSANSLLLYLSYGYANIESIISGDDCLQHLRLSGETMSLTHYLGLHAMSGSLHDRGICTQIKRRLFAKMYHGDKTASTFTGWPPTISRRFVTILLPLDMSDEVLLGAVPWRDDLVDEQGWNTLGEIYPSTLLRSRASIGFIRESILNISLQVTGKLNKQELLDLRVEEENTVNKLPQQIIFKNSDITNRAISGPELYAKLLVHLEHLLNLFFIERLINKVDNVVLSTALVQASLDIVSVTLIFWTHKDRLTGLHANYEWLAVGFASPAAGILCLELLRPYADNMDITSSLLPSDISRSDVVQTLSLLNGFLGWIEPLMPGRTLTGSFVQRVIQRVLDQTLNHPIEPVVQGISTIDWGAEMGLDMNDLSFDLLDTFDWMRPDP